MFGRTRPLSWAWLVLPLLATTAEAAAPPLTRTDGYGDPLPPGALARVGTTRLRHAGPITALAYSPDGKALASASHDRTVRVWDPATGKLLLRLGGHTDAVFAVAFAPDGKTLASGGKDGTVRLWDAATGRLLRTLTGHNDPVFCLAFTPDGRAVASGGKDGSVRLWDAATGQQLRRFVDLADIRHPFLDIGLARYSVEHWKSAIDGRKVGVYALAISPDGQTLATASRNRPVRLWKLATGERVRDLTPGPQWLFAALAFSPDGKTLAAGDNQNQIFLWDMRSGKLRRELPTKNQEPVSALAFAPDGKTLATISDYRGIALWDPATGKERIQIKNPRIDTIVQRTYALAFAPDGKTLASGGSSQEVMLWDPATGKEKPPSPVPPRYRVGAVSPDGKLLVLGAVSGEVDLFDTNTGRVVRRLEKHPWSIAVAGFTADGKAIISGDNYEGFRVRSVASGKDLQPLIRHGISIWRVNLSADGSTLAYCDFQGKPIHVLDTRRGKELDPLPVAAPSGQVADLTLSVCGRRLAAGVNPGEGDPGGARVEVWDVAAGRRLSICTREKDCPRYGLVFSRDSRSLAAGASFQGDVVVWEAATGQLRALVKGGDLGRSVEFSHDGTMLALSDGVVYYGFEHDEPFRLKKQRPVDHRLVLWDLLTEKEIAVVTGHADGFGTVKFFPDGKRLLTVTWDGTATVWDVAALAKRAPVPAPSAAQARTLWGDLGGDARVAFKAVLRLSAAPDRALPLLRDHLRAVPPVDAKEVRRFLDELQSPRFAVRSQATQALKQRGESAEPLLHALLKGAESLEVRRRVQQVLDGLQQFQTPERRRLVRALEVLERVGDVPARRILEDLAQGAPGAWLTEEAQATLERLKKRQ